MNLAHRLGSPFHHGPPGHHPGHHPSPPPGMIHHRMPHHPHMPRIVLYHVIRSSSEKFLNVFILIVRV